jgi:hypothetical protein
MRPLTSDTERRAEESQRAWEKEKAEMAEKASITTKSGRVYSTKKLKVHKPTKVVTGKFKSALSDYYRRKIVRLQKEIVNAKLALIRLKRKGK